VVGLRGLQLITKPTYPVTGLLPRKGIRWQAAQIFFVTPKLFRAQENLFQTHDEKNIIAPLKVYFTPSTSKQSFGPAQSQVIDAYQFYHAYVT